VEGDDWKCLAGPGKKAQPGDRFQFGDGKLAGEVLEIVEDGMRKVRFSYEGSFYTILDEIGNMPLPPYIKERLQDKSRYQTVYAKIPGSAAAPTAGLHFTPELLNKIKEKGVDVIYLTLHVGLGTFRPVKVKTVEEHVMHSEHFTVDADAAYRINTVKKSGGRVIAVGTTSCRTLETLADGDGFIKQAEGDTSIFIYPPYRFKAVDALITNFHLPESTLIMLVSALAGKENILNAYKTAVAEEYRFFSFGDAMFIK
jgi:S-adenosylmethionine:tRNA ribosyltransferase-isomerase